jgi:methyl-accepting chemotaxis protein
VGLFVIIAICGVGTTSIILSYNAIKSEAVNGLVEASNQGANYIESQIKASTDVLMEVSNSLDGLTNVQQMNLLRSEASKLGYHEMAIVDMNGNATYARSGKKEDMGDNDYVQRALKGEMCFSNLYISDVTLNTEIMYVAPIKLNGSISRALIGKKVVLF